MRLSRSRSNQSVSWPFGLAVTRWSRSASYYTPDPVNTWMGDCLTLSSTVTASTPSRYVTSHLGQLSLQSIRGKLIEYQPFWLRLSRGAFTCVGWQVTLCDPIWQVTSRNSGMYTRRAYWYYGHNLEASDGENVKLNDILLISLSLKNLLVGQVCAARHNQPSSHCRVACQVDC